MVHLPTKLYFLISRVPTELFKEYVISYFTQDSRQRLHSGGNRFISNPAVFTYSLDIVLVLVFVFNLDIVLDVTLIAMWVLFYFSSQSTTEYSNRVEQFYFYNYTSVVKTRFLSHPKLDSSKSSKRL